MKLTISMLAALATAVLAADSSQPNPFKIPESGLNTKASSTLNLQWNPTTPGTVSLILRSGASSNLDSGAFIVQKIQNSGNFAWNVPSSITRGSDYTVEIVSDSDPSQMNYTPYFVIDSDNTVATSTGTVTLGAPTESLAGSATGTVSADSTSMPKSTESATGKDTTMTTSTSSSSSSTSSSTSSTSSDMSSTADATGTSTDAADAASTTDALMSTGGAGTNKVPLVAAGVLAIGAMVL